MVELKKQTRFEYKEMENGATKSVYHGKDSTEYSGEVFKSKQNRQFLMTNDFTTASHAFMVFDKSI